MNPEQWHYTIVWRGERYDAESMEEVKPEHRAAVAMLMAVYPDDDDYSEAAIPGVGRITNFTTSGPLIELSSGWRMVGDDEKEQ